MVWHLESMYIDMHITIMHGNLINYNSVTGMWFEVPGVAAACAPLTSAGLPLDETCSWTLDIIILVTSHAMASCSRSFSRRFLENLLPVKTRYLLFYYRLEYDTDRLPGIKNCFVDGTTRCGTVVMVPVQFFIAVMSFSYAFRVRFAELPHKKWLNFT